MQRHLTVKECPRRYWFEYVAMADRAADETVRSAVRELKRLNSLRFLSGLAVHLQIQHYGPLLKEGKPVEAAEMAAKAAAWVEEWKAKGRDGLCEVRNGADVPDAVFKDVKARAAEELEAFAGRWWQEAGDLEGLALEERGAFDLAGARVKLRVDALGRDGTGQAVVVDWKTGEDDPAYESDLQMAVYAAWVEASGHAGGKPVETRIVFLKAGNVRRRRFQGEAGDEVAAAVKQDMEFMEPPPSRAAARPEPAPDRCLACNFATVCEAADLSAAKREPWA